MTIVRELVVPLADVLYAVSIRCATCRAVITLDLSDPRGVARQGAYTPRACPVCRTAFDTTWQRLDALQEVYASLKDFGDQITFRVRLPAEDAEHPRG